MFAEESFPFADTYINQQTASPTPLFAAWLQGFSTTSSSETNTQENGTTASTENHQQESMSENQPIFGNGLSEENSENMQLTIADPISAIPLQTVLQQDNETTPEQRSRSDGKRPECTASLDLDPIGNIVSPLPSRLEQLASRTTTATESTHPMVTRSKAGISKPNKRYAMLAHKVSHPMPKTVTEALKDEKWTAAMNVLGSKWVFRVKLLADGSLDKYKARLVAQGFNQEEGIDYLETYSPVVRSATVRAVLHLATIMNWELKQMDVKNAYLHGDLTETVYMKQPAGFVKKALPNHVCLLHKSLYGLKQSPRAWFDKFSNFLLSFGFVCSFSDPSLFVCVKNSDVIMLLLNVDDMVITGDSSKLLSNLLNELNKQFKMKDLGKLNYFLGIQAQFHQKGLFLSEPKYAEDLLFTAGMKDCAPVATPLPIQPDNAPHQSQLFDNPTYFRSLAGKLQYLTLTRPDIQFSVNYVCQKMHAPTLSDFHLLKRILRYIKGTTTMGISFNKNTDCKLRAYSDSDHAGCHASRRSTGGFCTFLGNNLISWSSRKQPTVAKSSTEAEYRAMSETASEITWIVNLLKDLGVP